MNRRHFLRSAAALFAAIACTGPKLLEGPPPPQFTAGFVGAPWPNMPALIRVNESVLTVRAIERLSMTPPTAGEWLEVIMEGRVIDRVRKGRVIRQLERYRTDPFGSPS